MLKNLLALLAFLASASSACHKAEGPAAGPTEGSDSPNASAELTTPTKEQLDNTAPPPQPAKPLPPPPPAVTARAENAVRQAVTGDVDAFLTAELNNFIQQKKRLPESFAEFATLRLDSIPRPPENKKWVIDASDLQVKAVPAK